MGPFGLSLYGNDVLDNLSFILTLCSVLFNAPLSFDVCHVLHIIFQVYLTCSIHMYICVS